nr:K(+) efflux antiporter 5 [Tanacetum cinerariifolium]
MMMMIVLLFCGRISVSARSDKETRERFYGSLVNSSAPESGDASIAKMFDRVLEKEFSDNESTDEELKGEESDDVALMWR